MSVQHRHHAESVINSLNKTKDALQGYCDNYINTLSSSQQEALQSYLISHRYLVKVLAVKGSVDELVND